MTKLENILARFIFVFVLLLSIPAIWALLVPGYYGASDDLHVAWLFEMDHTLKLGQIPPRFVPDLSYQFGYPLFNFVFPLPFYLGEIFYLIGFNLVDSVKAVFLLSVPLSMYFMYKLIRQFSGVLLSLAAAVLYVYTPYRATDLYVRGAIGEILGFVFLPIVCLSIIKIFTTEKRLRLKWIGIGASSIGLLILTHDIMAYMFFPLITILAVILLQTTQKKKTILISLAVMGILGLLVSLYFWYPAIVDSKLMKYDTVFNFQDHFPTIKQLVTPFWGYGASVAGPYDGMSFFIGIVNWLTILISIPLLIIWRRKFNKVEILFLGWGYAIFLIAFGMMNYRSIPLWKVLPELPYFQFPWRFLILTTFATPLFLIVLEKFKYSKYIGLGLIVIIIAINAFQFRPHDFLGRTDAYYLDKYIPTDPVSEAYRQTQEEYLRLPKFTESRPDGFVPEVYGGYGLDITRAEVFSPFRVKITTSSEQEINVFYRKYVFPGWEATLDNNPITIYPGKPYGQISLLIPSGNHTVDINFRETFLKIILDLISLASLLTALFLIFPQNWYRFKRG